MNQTSYQPSPAFRVLATDWEAETHIECWTETYESAECICEALRRDPDVTVQIDRLAEKRKEVVP